MILRRTLRWFVLLLGGMGLCCAAVGAESDSLSRRFQAANEAYAQGQYAQAIDRYGELLDEGREGVAVYYNLGNAYAKIEEWGQAIRYYEKARQLRPADPRIEHNLEQTRRRAGVYVPGRTPPQGLKGLVREWSPLAMFWGSWGLLAIGVGAAWFWGRSSLWTALRHPLVWGPVGAGLLGIALSFGTAYVQSLDHRAVVVAGQAPLRAAPTPDAVSDTTLPEGVLVEIQARRAQWSEVRLPDGTTGWVSAQALGDV